MTMNGFIVTDVAPRIRYVATEGTTEYFYPFPVLKEADLKVVFDDGAAPAISYSVTGVGQSGGGSIVFQSAPAPGTCISIYRQMVPERTTDFLEDGDFRAAVINEELDRMAMLLQEAAARVGDAISKPPYDSSPPLSLPDAATRAGRVLAFGGDGSIDLISAPATVVAQSNAERVAAEAARNEAQAAAQSAADLLSQATASLDVLQTAIGGLLSAAGNLGDLTDPAVARSNLGFDGNSGVVKAGDIDPGVVLGGPSLGTGSVIRTNACVISENITVPAGSNGFSAGPITIADGFSVTVENGANWSVV